MPEDLNGEKGERRALEGKAGGTEAQRWGISPKPVLFDLVSQFVATDPEEPGGS